MELFVIIVPTVIFLLRGKTRGIPFEATNSHTRSSTKFRSVLNKPLWLTSMFFALKSGFSHFSSFDNMRLMSVAGIPSQKPKEQQRSVLRPAVLQAPPSKSHIESSKQLKPVSSLRFWNKLFSIAIYCQEHVLCPNSLSDVKPVLCYAILYFSPSSAVDFIHLDSTCGTNGVKKSSDETPGAQSLFLNNTEHSTPLAKSLVRGAKKTPSFVFQTCWAVRSLVSCQCTGTSRLSKLCTKLQTCESCGKCTCA